MQDVSAGKFGFLICCDCEKKSTKNMAAQVRCLQCSNIKSKKNNVVKIPKFKKNCQFCNTEFISHVDYQLFCSDKCREGHKLKGHTEKWMEKKKKKPYVLWNHWD
jgi:hypothetical protein